MMNPAQIFLTHLLAWKMVPNICVVKPWFLVHVLNWERIDHLVGNSSPYIVLDFVVTQSSSTTCHSISMLVGRVTPNSPFSSLPRTLHEIQKSLTSNMVESFYHHFLSIFPWFSLGFRHFPSIFAAYFPLFPAFFPWISPRRWVSMASLWASWWPPPRRAKAL